MKKALISISALALAGLVLASCSNGGLKAPKKGKSVSEISLTFNSNEINIKDTDSFDDAMNKISLGFAGGIYVSHTDKEVSFKGSYSQKFSTKAENFISNGRVVKKSSNNTSVSSTTEEYYKKINDGTSTSQSVYSASTYGMKSKIINDKYELKIDYTRNGIYSGNLNISNNKYDIKAGRYSHDTFNYDNKYNVKSDNNVQKNNTYQYIEGNFDDNDPAIYDINHAYGPDGQEYSYSYNNFVEFDDIYQCNLQIPEMFEIYSESSNLRDYFETSFELTDKEIILKMKTSLTSEVGEFASTEAQINSTEFKDEVDKALQNSFKGSYNEVELWFSYDSNFETYGFAYSYYNYHEYVKYNINYNYTDDRLAYMKLTSDLNDELKGKTYKKTGTVEGRTIIVANNDSYDKKIDKFLNKAKKNNLFDSLKFVSSSV